VRPTGIREDGGVVSFPPYPVGLRLGGRRVLVVGGGPVAQRRISGLLAAGADVHVVSPAITPAIEGMLVELTWHERVFEAADIEGAWYAVAATDSALVNADVASRCEAARIFCVRADDASEATAWTPAVARESGVTIAVLANREPRRSAAVRDAIVAALRDGTVTLEATHAGGPPPDRSGSVVLVGGGPGDPSLITVAGRRALMSADVVIADRLAPRELLDELPSDVELIDVAKLPRGRSATQEFINETLVARALAGQRVVRFKGGDSFVFGRGYEEVQACREAGVPVTVIPGITSPVSVPGLAGIPVTHRGVAHDFTVISGHVPPGHADSLTDWSAVARLHGTLLLMMAVDNAGAIADALISGGMLADRPAAIVVDGGMASQRTEVGTLGELGALIEKRAVRPPAIIVIGEVVSVAGLC
jgi:uroporphyrin-III C-methyltransferase/precorrin-2 dehydrogenase/sirohydrochlorin ferrochelatase